MTGHLRPTAPIFADVLLPADPGVALALAQQLLVKPLMSNHTFGLWGYSGQTHGGHALTIQAAGIGGPSAATVLAELAGLGAKHAIGLATCTALDPSLADGTVVIAERALADPGAAAATGVDAVDGDPALGAALAAACPGARSLTVASAYIDGAAGPRPLEAGAGVTDLITAALLGTGRRLGLGVACALVVVGEAPDRVSQDALLEAGAAAARALTSHRAGP